MGNFTGYIILVVFAILFIGISFIVSNKFPIEGVDDFVAAGRGIPAALISASVMVSWVWATTLMASAEAGMSYGISGGVSYAWGNALPFFVLIPLILHIRKKMPKCTTFTEFIEQRFGSTTSKIFFIFGIGVTMYILIEQAVGIGIVFNSMFDIPYEIACAVPIIVVTIYIAKAGLRGSIFNDVIQFFIISIILIITVPLVLKTLGFDGIYQGLVNASTDPSNPYYNEDALNFFSGAGFRYGMIAVVVATGQVLLDQGYYSKAIACGNSKSLFRAYIIGTVFAWMPVPIICGSIFGGATLSLGKDIGLASEAAPYLMKLIYGGGLGAVMFVLMVFMAAMTTGGGCFAGIQALFTTDFYKKYINKTANEFQTINFGRKVTFIIGVIVIIVAILLKGKSLLMLDILSGIFFAAPAGCFVAGAFSKKVNSKTAIASIVLGLGSGIAAWQLWPNPDMNTFVGNMCSLLVPVIVVLIGSFLSKDEFDFDKLKDYEPDHEVKTVEG